MSRTPDQESRWNRLDDTNRRSNLPLTLLLAGVVGFGLWAASTGAIVVESNNNSEDSGIQWRAQPSEAEEQNFCGSWSWVFEQKAEICLSSGDESVCGIPSGASNKWSVQEKIPQSAGFRNVFIYCDKAVSIYRP